MEVKWAALRAAPRAAAAVLVHLLVGLFGAGLFAVVGAIDLTLAEMAILLWRWSQRRNLQVVHWICNVEFLHCWMG